MSPIGPVRLRLRTWLIALSFVAMLPLLLFSAYLLWELKEQQEQLLVQDLQHRAANVARRVDARINVAVSALLSLAESDAARHADLPALYAQAKRIIGRTPAFRAVTLVDAQGRMHLHTTIPYGEPTFAANHQALCRRVLETGKPNVSGPFVAPISPRIVVAVSVPVVIGGRSDSCLRLILLSDSINQLLAEQQLPAGWIAGIVDREGLLVARTHQADKFIGRRAAADFLAAIQRGERQPFQGTTLEGVRTTNIVAPIYEGDWQLVLGVPNSILNAPLHDMLRKMAWLAVLWLAMSFIVARALANYLTAQTRAVGRAILFDAGHLPPRLKIRVSELWSIFLGLQEARRQEMSARSDLQHVATQRDEVQDLYDNAPCGYHSLDAAGRIVQINQTELDWLGRSKDDVIGRPFPDFITEASRATFRKNFPEFLKCGHVRDVELELVRKDGSTMPVLISATAIRDDAGALLMSRTTMFDITERKRLELRLDQLARTDVLTGLSNRRDFYAHAERELARSRRFGTPLSLVMLDIDHFKQVNDRHGHAAGDEVLKTLSEVCRSVLRSTDIPARLGGEEFAILMPQTVPEQAVDIAERLRARLAGTPVAIRDGLAVSFTVSIGVAPILDTDRNVDTMLGRADAALYEAKRNGRNQVRRADGDAGLAAEADGR